MKNAALKVLALIFLLAFALTQAPSQTNTTSEAGTNSVAAADHSPQPPKSHHHHSDNRGNYSLFDGINIPIAAFIMVVCIVAICAIARHHRDKMLHETIRAMVEKGMPVDSALIAQLDRRRNDDCGGSPPASRRSRSARLFYGLVCLGVGLALLITSHWHSTAGLILLFVGIAFLIARLIFCSCRLLYGLICTGVGLALLISSDWHSMGGLIVFFVGIAFLIVWLVERNQNGDPQPPKP